MVIYWSLSDSKSRQFVRTLLIILTNLNNAVVWMVSTLPLISNSSCLSSKSTNYIWYQCSTAFLILSQIPNICQPFRFISFSFWGPSKRQTPLDSKLSPRSLSLSLSLSVSVSLSLLTVSQAFWPGLSDPFVSQNPREFYVSYSLGQILVSVCTI